MSESVSKKVREIVDRTPFLRDVLRKGFLNYSNYAQSISEEISQSCTREVKESAIIMALRRYADELSRNESENTVDDFNYTISMHTNIVDFNFKKTPDLVQMIGNLYKVAGKNGANEFLNVSLGSDEVIIALSDSLLPHVDRLMDNFRPIYKKNDLVAVTMIFGSDGFVQTPGIVYEAARRLAWNSINVLEIISTTSELTFIIKRTDSFEAYRVLQNLQGRR